MKFYLNEKEIGWMKQYHPDLYENMKDVIEPYVPIERDERLKEINERLGEKVSELGYGMASDQNVSGVRNRGITPNTVFFDEAHNLSEVYSSGEPRVVTQKWLEHRRVCRRTLLECLSGTAH